MRKIYHFPIYICKLRSCHGNFYQEFRRYDANQSYNSQQSSHMLLMGHIFLYVCCICNFIRNCESYTGRLVFCNSLPCVMSQSFCNKPCKSSNLAMTGKISGTCTFMYILCFCSVYVDVSCDYIIILLIHTVDVG